MSFTQILLNRAKDQKVNSVNNKITESVIENITEANDKKPEELLRGAGFKIKLITPTSFGTQISLAKKYEEEEIRKILDGFTVKIKGKELFVVE